MFPGFCPCLLDARAGGLEAVAVLACCEAGEECAQQVLVLCAEGFEQLGLGVVAGAGHVCLDAPAGHGYFWDAGAAVARGARDIARGLRAG